MKLALFLTLCATVLAAPAPPANSAAPGASCTFSLNEKSNLGHNHDVNTGQLLVGGRVMKGAPKIGGSGCSPAWAVGGAPTDNTPTKTSVGVKGANANAAPAPASGAHAGHSSMGGM